MHVENHVFLVYLSQFKPIPANSESKLVGNMKTNQMLYICVQGKTLKIAFQERIVHIDTFLRTYQVEFKLIWYYYSLYLMILC